jgi:HK97 family phage portal protein
MGWFKRKEKALQPAGGGLLGMIRELFTGAWQSVTPLETADALRAKAVYACINRIAQDISKLDFRAVGDNQGVAEPARWHWASKLLLRPNHYQTRIQFIEAWIVSRLISGNVYVLKTRDADDRVDGLHVLHPGRVTVLVADDGSVFYRISADTLAGEPIERTVPASEIIHDRFNCLHHPLIGVSPIYACGMAAAQSQSIQSSSTALFQNMARPSGFLVTPHKLSPDGATLLKTQFDSKHSGKNQGGVAVLTEGVDFKPMVMSAVDAQLINQLQWTDEAICSVFSVPAYMVGVGPLPNYSNIQSLNQQYYSQCLQSHIEAIELSLDYGLGLERDYWIECDLDGLLRMDTASLFEANNLAVGGGWMKPNEARRRAGLPPVEGGDTPYMQQQNFALAMLAKQALPAAKPLEVTDADQP